LKRSPSDVRSVLAVRYLGHRMEAEGATLIEYAVGESLIANADKMLATLGQPAAAVAPPPLLRALAVELTCNAAIIAGLDADPAYQGDAAYLAAEREAFRTLALTYFAEARAAGDDPDALDALVNGAARRHAAAATATPAASLVLEKIPVRYAELARERAAR
jgi:hypothetical protein